MHARHWLLSIQIALELLTVVARGFVLWPVGNLGRGDRNPGRVARAHLVRHHQHQVCVGNQCDREGPLAAALVAVSENPLQWPLQPKSGLVQLVEVSFLVTRLWLGFVDVGHLQQWNWTSVLHLEVLQLLFSKLIIWLLDPCLTLVIVADNRSSLLNTAWVNAVVVVIIAILLVVVVWIGAIVILNVVPVLGSRQGPGPIWVPEVMNFHPDDGHSDVPNQPVEQPGHHLERCQDDSSWTSVIGVFQADCLVIVDLDLLEHMILLQALQDSSVNLTKEFASVERILGDHDETIVVEYIAFNRFVLAGEEFSTVGLQQKGM